MVRTMKFELSESELEQKHLNMIEKIETLKKENITADESLHDVGWNGAINEVLKILEAGQHEPFVMWNFSKIETPDSGDYVWACNARDKQSKLIKWGTGDEAFYSYWMPAEIPAPPQAT